MLEKSILLQDKILNYISREIRIKGYPPTIREIADEMQIKSASTVHMHLRSLEKRGLIRRNPSKPRAIELVSSSEFSEYVKTHPVVCKAFLTMLTKAASATWNCPSIYVDTTGISCILLKALHCIPMEFFPEMCSSSINRTKLTAKVSFW